MKIFGDGGQKMVWPHPDGYAHALVAVDGGWKCLCRVYPSEYVTVEVNQKKSDEPWVFAFDADKLTCPSCQYMTRRHASQEARHEFDRVDVKPGQLYRHDKGELYAVVATALDEATLAPVVVYELVHTVHGRASETWARPLEVFLARFVHEGDVP